MTAALVVTRRTWPGSVAFARVEPISWIGGALGGIYVAISIFALPRLGVVLLLALIVVGQMLASLASHQFNRFSIVPALRRERSENEIKPLLIRLRHHVLGEQALGAAVLLTVGFLGTMEPAVNLVAR